MNDQSIVLTSNGLKVWGEFVVMHTSSRQYFKLITRFKHLNHVIRKHNGEQTHLQTHTYSIKAKNIAALIFLINISDPRWPVPREPLNTEVSPASFVQSCDILLIWSHEGSDMEH